MGLQCTLVKAIQQLTLTIQYVLDDSLKITDQTFFDSLKITGLYNKSQLFANNGKKKKKNSG